MQPILYSDDFPLWGKLLIALVVAVPLIFMVRAYMRNRRL